MDSDASSDATASDGGSSADGSIAVDATSGDGKVDAGPSLRVFVTSTTYSGDKLGSPDGICASAAEGLGGQWRAWISHPLRQATNVIGSADGPWRTMNGTLVAQNKAQLLSGVLAAGISVDESGNPRDVFVWTGTSVDGSDLSHCSGWSETNGFQGTYGRSASSDATWTNGGTASCTNTFAVYCFEIAGA